jgi:hypothetical protein
MRRAPFNARVIYEAHPSGSWYTPLELRTQAQRWLCDSEGRITLDFATCSLNALNARVAVTRKDNALKRDVPWVRYLDCVEVQHEHHPTAWLNPPFGRDIGEWIDRVLALVDARPELRMVCLLPARPGTAWFSRVRSRAAAVCELRGRLRFERKRGRKLVPARQPARWGCVLVYFGPGRGRVLRDWRALGDVQLGRVQNVPRPAPPDPRQGDLYTGWAPTPPVLCSPENGC